MRILSSTGIKVVIVAIALGTAWAVRGQFGHEHGAAWAGGIGVLALLLLARRADWYSRIPSIAAIGAIAWGVGGMMSYGVVVGYGRGLDWLNVSYGLCMLFVIGGLYGFIGGGLTGLALESSDEHKPAWATLLTQMVAGGYLIWGILIYQLEWLMTPPRSELWAACLGAALALGWFLYRNRFRQSLSVAIYTSLGAGFGFAFGNFLQVMGSASGIAFNWWNVMEYSLGFFGGLGMAYAVYSQEWAEGSTPDHTSNRLGWLFLIILLPLTNIIQRFDRGEMVEAAESLGVSDVNGLVTTKLILVWGGSALLVLALSVLFRSKIRGRKPWGKNDSGWLLMIYLGWYICLSNIHTGSWWGHGSLRDGLYWINLLLIAVLGYYIGSSEHRLSLPTPSIRRSLRLALILMVLLLGLSWVLIHSHGEMSGSQIRFSLWQ